MYKKLSLALLISVMALANGASADEDFAAYLLQVRQQAVADGIAPETVSRAFEGIERDERVIGFDRKQPEFVQTFDEYLEARVTDFRKREGRRLVDEHGGVLAQVADRYEVEPNYIVAFWGLETSFGRYQGKYSVIRSLATLGHDPRRSAFFTKELIHALHILDEGHVSRDAFLGGWAGAMGQSQFMPSSFRGFAQDFDGDGRKNIWSSEADVFASIANYLMKAGWQRHAGWGGAAVIRSDLDMDALKPATYDTTCRALRGHSRKLSLTEWQALGVEPVGDLPPGEYALIFPGDGESATQGYLAGGNFRAILSYNCANKYAVSVGLLADAIASP